MISALDSSVLVGALHKDETHHAACLKILTEDKNVCCSYALTETFSTLTGGKLGFRVPASQAASVLKNHVVPRLKVVSLSPTDLLKAYAEAESRGIRGGAIYDYLHLVAARKAGAERFLTLNLRDFRSFHRPGDPEIAAC